MIWILIPLAGMALGGFAMWLEHKKETRQLGSSTKDLEHEVASLQEKLERSERRLQNLEAIVTSHDWDQLKSEEAPLRERFLEITEESDKSQEEEAAQIARRVSE